MSALASLHAVTVAQLWPDCLPVIRTEELPTHPQGKLDLGAKFGRDTSLNPVAQPLRRDAQDCGGGSDTATFFDRLFECLHSLITRHVNF
jgi:hypothetical protein